MRVFLLAHIRTEQEYNDWKRDLKKLVRVINKNILVKGLVLIGFKDIKNYSFTIKNKKYRVGKTIPNNKNSILNYARSSSDLFYFYGHFNSAFIGSCNRGLLKTKQMCLSQGFTIYSKEFVKIIAATRPKVVLLDSCYGCSIDFVYQMRNLKTILVAYTGYSDSGTLFLKSGIFRKNVIGTNNMRVMVQNLVSKIPSSKRGKLVAIDLSKARSSLTAIKKLYATKKLKFSNACIISSYDSYYYSLCCVLKNSRVDKKIIVNLEKSIIASTPHKRVYHLGICGYEIDPAYKKYITKMDWYR